MNVEVKHVSLVEIAVHERLLAPVVVSNLFPNHAGFAPHGENPVVSALSQTDVLDGVPKILSLGGIGKETPVVVLAKQVIGTCRGRGFGCKNRLASRV